MRRSSACFGLLFVMLGWCIDDPLQQRVSYDKPGQTLKSLLRDLSAQTNLKLYAAPPLDTEIVLVAVQDMPLQTLMEHIAYVVDGEWIAESERQYRLARTPKVIKARTQQDREQALADLREMLASEEFRRLVEPLTREQVIERIEQIREQLRKLIEENSDERKFYYQLLKLLDKGWAPLSPDHRLLCRILQQIDLNALVDIPIGERRVFSNAPGRYLLPLRVNLTPLIEQWLNERTVLHAVIADPRYQFDKEILESYDYLQWVEDILEVQGFSKIHMPEKVYLEVIRYRWRGDFLFSLHLADDQNRCITVDYYSPQSEWEEEEERLARLSKQDSALVQLVEWREETQRWLEAWRMLQSKGEIKPFPDLLDPAKHEPLQFVPSDVVRSYARHKSLPLVALLDDQMLWWIRFARPSGQRVARFFTLEDAWEISVKDGVLNLKPYLSSLQWYKHENREAASRWIQQIVARGYLEINDALEAEHQPRLADLYLWHIGTGHFAYLPDASRSILPFLKNLLDRVESHSESKIELTLQRLSPNQIQELERVVYYSYGRVSLLESDKERYNGMVDTERPVIRLPHAYFPNGLPRDAALVLKMEREDGVLSQRSGVGVWGGFYHATRLWMFLAESNDDDKYIRDHREFIQSSLLLPVQRQQVRLSAQCAPYEIVVLTGYEVRGYRLKQGLKPVRWEQLPPEWLKPPDTQEAGEDP
jgi:hypothetical protein